MCVQYDRIMVAQEMANRPKGLCRRFFWALGAAWRCARAEARARKRSGK